MNIGTIVSALNLVSALVAFAAAYYWHRSATFKVQYDPAKDDGSAGIIMEVGDKKYDYFATGASREETSRRGALFAGLAALFQGIALALGGLVA